MGPIAAIATVSRRTQFALGTPVPVTCHTADATAPGGRAPLTIRSYAQWVHLVPPALVTVELWPAAATSIQNDSALAQGPANPSVLG